MARGLKQKLGAGQPVVVVNPDHPSPGLVQFIGRLPVDAVFIDCEQGSAGIETMENMVRAARVGGLGSLVRLFSPDDWVIERYMLRGVDGIVVPRIDTAEAARRVVAAVRYCFPNDHAEKVVVVQIETRSALDELSEFLAIDGIDVLFVGPVDLAKSLGFAGNYRLPEVQAAIDQAISTIVDAGKLAGMLVGRDDVAAYLEKGVRFLYTHANDFLDLGAADFRRRIDGGA